MERRKGLIAGRRPGVKKDKNTSQKQQHSPSLAMKQKVVELLDKSRRLKRDITKALITEEEEGSPLQPPPRELEEVTVLTPSFVRGGPQRRTLDESDFVDLVLGESFASTDLRDIGVSLRSDVVFSSCSDCDDDEFSDDDPLRNENIIESLFYGGVDHLNQLKKEERNPSSLKRIEGKRVNFVAKKQEKSLPHAKQSPLRKTSNISSRKGPNLDLKKVQDGGQNAKKNDIPSRKIIVPTKDLVVDPLRPLNVFCLLTIARGSAFGSSIFESIRSRTLDQNFQLMIDTQFYKWLTFFAEGTSGRNLYLKCRMFWNIDTAKSDVCWNSNNPSFRFQQVTPILLNDSLLERVQNNIMVIEVWEKRISFNVDQLVGICKVPLHLFYLSFRDREVAESLLRSQNAVIAANDMLPVVDLFNGRNVGRLGVLLALGTRDQIETLRKSSVSSVTSLHSIRTIEDSAAGGDVFVTHTFTVTVDSLTLDVPPGSTIWAESDCYVQYLFPNQIPVDDLRLGSVYLSVHRLNRVLCEPVMHWKSKTKHVIVQSSSVSIRKTLLGVCPRNGLPFQVWCKYYYPVEKEELVAEVFVPVATLCSLIKDGRSFVKLALPLVTSDPNLNLELNNSLCDEFAKLGTLNIELSYQDNDKSQECGGKSVETRTESKTEQRCPLVTEPIPSEMISDRCEPERDVQTFPASITIERAVHLPLMNANKMPNAYVSFATLHETHFTDVVPRSDEPQWNWQKKVDLPVTLISPQLSGALEFKVCHSDDVTTRNESDIVLGCVLVELGPLLLGFSQLCGWYNLINTRSCCCGQIKVVIQPLCNLPTFRCQLHSSDLCDYSTEPDRYLTAGSYAEFPSHIGQFVEQKIQFKDDLSKQTWSDDSCLDDKSRSFLMTNLKERLVELDNLFGHTPVANETRPVTVVENVNFVEHFSADGKESPSYVFDKETEHVNPKIINLYSTKQQAFTRQAEKSDLSKGHNVCSPKRKPKSRIAAAIFGARDQNEFN